MHRRWAVDESCSGYDVSKRSVGQYLPKRRRPPRLLLITRHSSDSMLLRQAFMRSDAAQHAQSLPQTAHIPAFRLCRLDTARRPAPAAAQTAVHAAQLAEAAALASEHDGTAWGWLLQDAAPLQTPVPADAAGPGQGRIPPEQWGQHPKLLSGCGLRSCHLPSCRPHHREVLRAAPGAPISSTIERRLQGALPCRAAEAWQPLTVARTPLVLPAPLSGTTPK